MQTINVAFPIKQNKILEGPVVLALGFFDGVHLGHQRLIRKAREAADQKQIPLMVMTFSQHPRVYFAGQENFEYLTTLEEKAACMAELGVDYLTVFDFAEGVGALSPKDFVDQVIVELHAQVVVAGFDYTYGSGKLADMAHLPDYAEKRFEIIEIPEQEFAGRKIGSTLIRDYLDEGKVDEANQLLGYPYAISGKVVPGKQRGRQMGFRTANLDYPAKKILPGIGVYSTKIKVRGVWYEAMTSVGYNVTFGAEKKIFIETNIFDFDADIYGDEITVAWYHYLRGEEMFDSMDGLIDQLHLDQKHTKDYFKNSSN